MNRRLPQVIAAIVLIAVLMLYMVTYEVRTTEVAILKTFGRADESDVITEAGFGWKWPPPVQQIVKYDKRIRVLQDTFEETATRDQKNLVVTAYAAWRIGDALRFHQTVKPDNEKEAMTRIRDLMRSYKNDVIGQYDFSNFVSTRPDEMRFDEIESKLLQRVRDDARRKYGIEVVAVGIERLTLPRSITEQVFDRMRKTRDKIASEYRSEGEAEAAKIVSQAQKISDEILAFANRRADNIRAEGERQATEYYKTFEQDQQFALFLRTLDFFKKTLSEHTTVFLDRPPFDMFRTGPHNYTFPELPSVSTTEPEEASGSATEQPPAGAADQEGQE
jgi:membrane protease subunit HflC